MSMEAKARERAEEWLNGHFNGTYDVFDLKGLTSAFLDQNREGMEEAAKVLDNHCRCMKGGFECEACGHKAAIREEIK